MFFYLKSRFEVKKSYILDVNPELVVGYTALQRSPAGLIKRLKTLESDYLDGPKSSGKRCSTSIVRTIIWQLPDFNFDKYQKEWVNRTAEMIFLK